MLRSRVDSEWIHMYDALSIDVCALMFVVDSISALSMAKKVKLTFEYLSCRNEVLYKLHPYTGEAARIVQGNKF
jgi:hypothetical protein